MTTPEDLAGRVEEAITVLEGLFEAGEASADSAALICPTMGPDTLEVVGEFLATSLTGILTFAELRNEARTWLEVALAGWPFDSPTALVVLRALTGLAALEPEQEPDQPEPPATTPLERALEAALTDPATRPALWKALWYGTIFLPVAEADFESDEAAMFRFVTVDIGGDPTIFGFTTEERLDLVAPDRPVGRVEPTGEELARFWPDGHWLVLNPGFTLSTVLSPAEVKGLPDGPTMLVDEDARYQIEAPAESTGRLSALSAARQAVDGLEGLRWAVLRSPVPGRDRDVLVVQIAEGRPPQAVLAAFTDAASRAGFDNAIVVAANPDVDTGLTAQATEVGVAIA